MTLLFWLNSAYVEVTLHLCEYINIIHVSSNFDPIHFCIVVTIDIFEWYIFQTFWMGRTFKLKINKNHKLFRNIWFVYKNTFIQFKTDVAILSNFDTSHVQHRCFFHHLCVLIQAMTYAIYSKTVTLWGSIARFYN